MPLLQTGSILKSRLNNEYRIDNYLAHGGQAEIYLDTSAPGARIIKVYYPEWASELQRKILTRFTELGPPSPTFVWPMDFLEIPAINTFGIVLSHVDMERYVNLETKRFEDEGTNFFRDITSAILLADSFFRLHIRGLCYASINESTIFLEKKSGNVKIINFDDIIFIGEKRKGCGALSFNSPELIRGETIFPSADTDRYSLAVALFLLLFRIHPMNGKKFTDLPFVELEQMKDLYGRRPVFMFDPSNAENRPDDPEEHRVVNILWNVYPEYIRNLMITAFTKGLADPHNRVREMKWRSALMKLRDSIMKCPLCGIENFYPVDTPHAELACWNCGHKAPPPPVLKITGPGFRRMITLDRGTPICKGHIDNSSNIIEKIGIVEDAGNKKLGIKNISQGAWNYRVDSGVVKNCAKDRGILVSNRVAIEFTKNVIGTFIISERREN